MALTMLTVTASNGFVCADGSPGEGRVKVRPERERQGGGWIVVDADVVLQVARGQVVGADQLATDDEVTGLRYVITEKITGARNPGPYVVVPEGDTLDLSTASRGEVDQDVPAIYVLAGALGEPGGPATLDPDGLLEEEQRPPPPVLAGLQDTTGLAAATDGQVPAWHAETEQWLPATPSGGGGGGGIPADTVTQKGDLLAATGDATVVRLEVGTDGQVLTADPDADEGMSWQTPAGGGGGGSAARFYATDWDSTTTFGPAGSGQGLTPDTQMPTSLQLAIPGGEVTAGDIVVWRLGFISTGNDAQLDVASIVDGEPVNYYSGNFTPDQWPIGAGDLYQSGDYGLAQPITVEWVVQETDLAGDGSFALSLLYVAGNGTRVWGLAGQVGRVTMLNLGHA